jgi:hypothetical protein
MQVVMVSGAYRGESKKDISRNIKVARKAAKSLWQQGYAVVCPHSNSAHFDGVCSDEVWLSGYLEILKRCDGIFVLSNWRESKGTINEIKLAEELNKFILYE